MNLTPMTQEQWFERLRSWVPSWFLEQDIVVRAHLWALAGLIQQNEANAIDYFDATFIGRAEGRFLDHLGLERNRARKTNETDVQYRPRIRTLSGQADKPSIQDVATSQNGPLAFVQEDWSDTHFADINTFANVGHLLMGTPNPPWRNRFYVFLDRVANRFTYARYASVDAYASAGNFAVDVNENFEEEVPGQTSLDDVFDAINAVRAAGVRFTLVERQDLLED